MRAVKKRGPLAIMSIFAVVLMGASLASCERKTSLTPNSGKTALSSLSDKASIDRGRRLVALFGCQHCHGSALEGRKFVHKRDIRAFTPNLTLLADRSAEAFEKALRHGFGANQEPLYYMPAGAFSHLSDAEVQQIASYVASLKPSGQIQPRTQFGPQARRDIQQGKLKSSAELALEEKALFPMYVGPRFESGRRLARICVECHGAELRGRHTGRAPDLTIAAAYDLPDFRRLLQDGVAAGGRDVGLMSIAARQNFGILTPTEIEQLHNYLRARADRLLEDRP